jgi:ribosomal protein S18 acetylase RimI-like enzyme
MRSQPSFFIRPVSRVDGLPLHQTLLREKSREELQRLMDQAERYTQNRKGQALVAVHHETAQLIGFGQLVPWKRYSEISDLIVAETWRGCGVGTALIQHLIHYARKYSLNRVEIGVQADAVRTISLYYRLGFRYRHTKTFTTDGQDKTYLYLMLECC